MIRRTTDETGSPDAPDEADAPPPYSPGPRSHAGVNLSADQPMSGEELPPPYSPGLGVSQDVYEPPPHYYSLFGQLREARRETDNNLAFAQKVLQIFLNTIGCTVLLVVFMSIPLAVLVMGALHLGECPEERNIPIFLIVGGCSGVIKNIVLIGENIVKRTHRLSIQSQKARYAQYVWRAVNLVFNLFLLAWVVAGSYWVYHIYEDVNESSFDTCNELLYKFAFGILTCSYVLLVLMLSCTCCCSLCLRRRQDDEEIVSLEGGEGREEDDRESVGSTEADEAMSSSSVSNRAGSDQRAMQQENSVVRPHSSNAVVPPQYQSLTHSLEPTQLADYSASPIFGHGGPRALQVVQEPDQTLYTTMHLGGYSCTSV